MNLTNDKGDTLVMLAAYHRHAGTVAALLGTGCRPQSAQRQGSELLVGAVFKAECEVMKVLVRGGADVEAGTPSASETARMFGNAEILDT